MTTILKTVTSKLTALSIVAVILSGCHKKDTLGNTTDVCPSANFNVTTLFHVVGDLTTVDPVTQKLTMIAGFTEKINWTITITGDSLGVKTYTGKSDSINIDFYGNSENDHFFKKNEKCTVKFELGCGHEKFNVTKTFTYSGKPTMHNTDFGYLLNDFDGYPKTGAYSTSGGWPDASDHTKDWMKVNNYTADPSPQGGKAMLYYGYVEDSMAMPPVKLWYFSGFSSAITTQITALETAGITDTKRLYLNMYVRGYLTDYPNTQLQLTLEGLQESTETGKVAESKNYNLNLDWDGWKMVSIKFSDFYNLHDFPSIVNAATASKITNIGFGLGAGPLQASKTKALIDFLIITVDAPYKEEQKRNY
jgi:hypothetical protein